MHFPFYRDLGAGPYWKGVKIPIKDIRRGGTQFRVGTIEDTIEAYAEAMRAGAILPPIIVFDDGEGYWLGDGYQRIEAALRCGEDHIEADVRQNYEGETGQRAAVLFACGANEEHGLRRTNADKRRAVERLLADPEWGTRSDRWIAEMCRVGYTLVARIRAELPAAGSSSQPSESIEDAAPKELGPSNPGKRTGKDGVVRSPPRNGAKSKTSSNPSAASKQDAKQAHKLIHVAMYCLGEINAKELIEISKHIPKLQLNMNEKEKRQCLQILRLTSRSLNLLARSIEKCQ